MNRQKLQASQSTWNNGQAAEQPLALDRLRRGYARGLGQPALWFLERVLPELAASEAERKLIPLLQLPHRQGDPPLFLRTDEQYLLWLVGGIHGLRCLLYTSPSPRD